MLTRFAEEKAMKFSWLAMRLCVAFGLTLALLDGAATFAQEYDQKFFSEMHWRGIGPFRGGRTKAAAGVPTQPKVFYNRVWHGGGWQLDDYGRTLGPS